MRILIADDDRVSLRRLEDLFVRRGYEVMAVSDGTEAWQVLSGQNPPRLAVLDWLMDDMDGVEVCRRVRECPELRDVYLILLTSRGEQQHIVAGLQAGANDYVTKPFNSSELLARVLVGTRMVGLQAELAMRVQELAALAMTDGLTGIANRRTFEARLETECLRTGRFHSPLALIMLDLDNFKCLNDSYGHQAGDEVLRTMGRVLSSSTRNTDFVARYGGEEFAVILVNTDISAAKEAAERIRTRIATEPWPHGIVTASIGIASCEHAPVGVSEFISRADRALYFSKEHGRNRATHSLDMTPDSGSIQIDARHSSNSRRVRRSNGRKISPTASKDFF
jgi:two-component system cell cycle response regulator